MSSTRQQLLDAIRSAPDSVLEELLNFLQARTQPSMAESSHAEASPDIGHIHHWSTPSNTAAWNTALQKLQTPPNPQALAQLLQSWEAEGDEQDQIETWEFLRQALDQDRLSDRPLSL
jgi:hypothetical protein